jgi:hypothetical protein
MAEKSKTQFAVARAVARGDWLSVIDLEHDALVGDKHKQFGYLATPWPPCPES